MNRVPFGQTTIGLPFFRDMGANTAGFVFNGQRGDTLGAKDAPAKWDEFRVASNAAFLGHIVEAVQAKNPALPIVIRHAEGLLEEYSVYFGSFEKPASSPQVETPAPPAGAPSSLSSAGAQTVNGRVVRQGRSTSLQETARASAKTVYYAITPSPASLDIAAAKARLQARLPSEVKAAGSWDGLVLDLSTVSLKDALDTLSVLSAPQP
jgi:hypothetical protein